MKKVFYFLPIVTFLLFTSCEKEETSESVNENLETNPFNIETTTSDNGKMFTLSPGLYGPNETTPYTYTNYTLVVPKDILNEAPNDHAYRLVIRYKNPNSTGWIQAYEKDLPSNSVTLSFPSEFNGMKRDKWLISYGIYGSGIGYWYRFKEVTINH